MADLSQLSDAQLAALEQQLAPQPLPDDAAAGGGHLWESPAPNAARWLQSPEWLDRGVIGMGRGMVHAGRRAGNLLGAIPDSELQDEAYTDAPLMRTTAGKVGNAAGEAALTLPLGFGVGGVMARLGAGGRTLAPLAINYGTQGAAQGLVTSDPGRGGVGALEGGVTGAALPMVGGMASRLARGLERTPAAQYLLDQGVDLTPGLMNPRGTMNQLEQASDSAFLPLVKQWVHGSRDAAEQGYQARVIGMGAAPGATITPSEDLHEMLQQAYDSYAPLYDKAKGFPMSPVLMNTAGPNVPIKNLLKQAAALPGATADAREAAYAYLKNQYSQLDKANLDSADLLNLRSDIRKAARDARLSTDTIAADKGKIYARADQAITRVLESQLPPDALDALRTADSNYGNYKIVESAVAKSKDNLAGLTPAKLSEAVYAATADPAYARGAGGPLRDMAKAGKDVFQTVSPPTGARAVTTAGLVGAGFILPKAVTIPAAGGALMSVVTPTGRRLAQGATKPQRLAQTLLGRYDAAVPDSIRSRVSDLGRGAAVSAGAPAVPTVAAASLPLVSALMQSRKKPEGEAAAP